MPPVNYPQVYRPDGSWYASFYTREAAEAWVAKQENADGWEITMRRPERKQSRD